MVSLGNRIDLRRGKVVIGDDCVVTHDVVILLHDYATMLMGSRLINSQSTTISENNVFSVLTR